MSILPEHSHIIEKPLSLNEILIAIDALKLDKAPSPEGCTLEFYKILKLILVLKLHKVLVSACVNMEIPSSW